MSPVASVWGDLEAMAGDSQDFRAQMSVPDAHGSPAFRTRTEPRPCSGRCQGPHTPPRPMGPGSMAAPLSLPDLAAQSDRVPIAAASGGPGMQQAPHKCPCDPFSDEVHSRPRVCSRLRRERNGAGVAGHACNPGRQQEAAWHRTTEKEEVTHVSPWMVGDSYGWSPLIAGLGEDGDPASA
jgi:hypothetical protein